MRKTALVLCLILLACCGCSPAASGTMTARQTLDKYFNYMAHNDNRGMNTLLAGKSQIEVDDHLEDVKYFKVNSIKDITSDGLVNDYNTTGGGDSNLFNVRVFKVSYEIKFSDYAEPSIENGSYTLEYYVIQENKDSPWRIADWGWN